MCAFLVTYYTLINISLDLIGIEQLHVLAHSMLPLFQEYPRYSVIFPESSRRDQNAKQIHYFPVKRDILYKFYEQV